MNDQTQKIAKLNDEFRRSITQLPKGILILTKSVQDNFSESQKRELLREVQNFSDFNDNNDPYKERDFGSFEFENERILWKIDYYDLSMEYFSKDPTDPNQTNRVLTIMLARDY